MTNLADVIPKISPDAPLLIVDADEVLLRFVEHLEAFFESRGYELRLTSFQLSGNIFPIDGDEPAPPGMVKQLIAGFFEECVDSVPAVPDASDTLRSLADAYQIAILTNVPHQFRQRREAALRDLGFNFPVISNAGEKGPAMQQLDTATGHQSVFVDDLPPQLASVATHAPDVHRVHFVADERLAALIGKADHAHVRIDKWHDLETHLRSLLLRG